MSLYARLGLNFDTTQFGSAQSLSSSAANTLSLIANTSGAIPGWQQQVLSNGSPNRTDYFQNPTSTYLTSILSAANTIFNSANQVGDISTSQSASNLILEISKFRSHTDNVSGVAAVANTQFPSFQSAQNIGQLNMMTLSKSDGVSNTAPILGSMTSLFITNQLKANGLQIVLFANEYANSITANSSVDINLNTVTVYTSNLANTEVVKIQNYLSNTTNLMTTRRTGDWAFYRNSVQLAQDVGYMQQFSNMGGTATYVVNNLVGTQNLITNIGAQSTIGPSGAVPTPNVTTSPTTNASIVNLGVVVTGTWNANVVDTPYGGTGLSSFNANGAVYATSANTLTTGTLPVVAGGTGTKTSTGDGSVVLSNNPIITNANITSSKVISNNVTSSLINSTNVVASNIVTTTINTQIGTFANVVSSNVSTTSLNSPKITANAIGVNVSSPNYPVDAFVSTGEIAIQASSSYSSNYAWVRTVNTNNPSNPVDYGVSNDGSGRVIVRAVPTTGTRAFSVNYAPVGDTLYSDTSGRIIKPFQPFLSGRTGSTVATGYANLFTPLTSKGNLTWATDRVVAPVAGVYMITWQTICTNTASRTDTNLYVSGVLINSALSEDSTTGYHQRTHAIALYLNFGDYVQLYHSNWYNVNGTNEWSTFSIYLLG